MSGFDPKFEQAAYEMATDTVKAFLATARLRKVNVVLESMTQDQNGHVFCRWRMEGKDITLDSSGFVEIHQEQYLDADGQARVRHRQARLDKQSWPWFIKVALGGPPVFATGFEHGTIR